MTSTIQHIVSVSGGKDSTAMYLHAIESGRPFRAVFADTEWDHPATLEYVAALSARSGGPEIEVVRADFREKILKKKQKLIENGGDQRIIDALEPTGNAFIDCCILHGMIPMRLRRFCTFDLKVKPIQDQVIFPALRQGPVLQWIGERAEESSARAAKPRWNRADSGSMLWRPLLKWTLDDVMMMHKRHAMPLNPLYRQGCSRVGCWPCLAFASKAGMRAAFRIDPSLIEKLENLERLVSAAAQGGIASAFHSGDFGTAKGEIPTVRGVRNYCRTSRGGRSYDMFADLAPKCMSEWSICE